MKSHPEDIDRAQDLKEGLQSLVRYRKTIREVRSKIGGQGPSAGLKTMLFLLLFSVDTQITRILRAAKTSRDVDVVAWCTRNLMELDLWVQYVVASTENLRRFGSDWMLDEIGFWEAHNAWLESQEWANRLKESDKPVIESYLCQLRASRDRLVLPRKWLSIHEIAKQFGREKEYVSQNRLYSKIVHPTAWSILFRHETFRLREPLVLDASRHVLFILCRVVRALGVQQATLDKMIWLELKQTATRGKRPKSRTRATLHE